MQKQTFKQWMKSVDDLVESNYGMSLHDLPDMRFRDAYDNETPAQEFFNEELGTLGKLRALFLSQETTVS